MKSSLHVEQDTKNKTKKLRELQVLKFWNTEIIIYNIFHLLLLAFLQSKAISSLQFLFSFSPHFL